ncbi:MAG: DUF4190 domain-containing protein [Verrucomicrobiales bacterium]
MAVIKIACEKCGQRVSGDETFLGKSVPCPVCSHEIPFPAKGEKIPELKKRASEATEEVLEKTGDSREEPDAPAKQKKGVSTSAEPATAPAPAILQTKDESSEPARAKRSIPKPSIPSVEENLPVAPTSAGRGGPRHHSPGSSSSSGAALWSAILGVTTYVLFPVGIVFAILAILFGHVGRSSVGRAAGKLSGGGLANLGLMLGYAYIILLFFAAILVPWKPLMAFGIQKYNAGAASELLSALDQYAEDHDDGFPAELAELTPDYLEEGRLDTLQWIDPATFEFPTTFERHAFRYYGGHSREGDPQGVLLSSPRTDAAELRVVARINYAVELVPESEFIRQIPEVKEE